MLVSGFSRVPLAKMIIYIDCLPSVAGFRLITLAIYRSEALSLSVLAPDVGIL